MKSVFVLLLCTILVQVNAWIGLIQADPNTVHGGDCYTTHRNLGNIKVGEIKRIEGECAVATCKENGDIRLTGCSPIAVLPPRRVLPGDISKPFPQCCHEIVGPDNETENDLEPEREVNAATTSRVDLKLSHESNLL